jgi:hypothetical protein
VGQKTLCQKIPLPRIEVDIVQLVSDITEGISCGTDSGCRSAECYRSQITSRRAMSNSRRSKDWTSEARWGYLNFRRGRVLCVWVEKDKVLLIEPDGGYFYPMPGEVEPAKEPKDRTLLSAVSGASYENLEAISSFCAAPRTMEEIESEFPGIEAWRLRKLGMLKDVGRRNRRIVSEWVGWSVSALLDHIFSSKSSPSRKDNSPTRQN